MTSVRVPAVDADAAAREQAALAARLRESVDPLALGLMVREVRARGRVRVARRHRLRRVLRLLQLLSRRLGAAARVAVLQARHRAACPRGRVAARRRVHAAAVRRLFLGEGCVLAAPRQRARPARRRRLCVADHDRPRHVVGGCRGHHGAARSTCRRRRCWPGPRAACWPPSSASGGRCGASGACPSAACSRGRCRWKTMVDRRPRVGTRGSRRHRAGRGWGRPRRGRGGRRGAAGRRVLRRRRFAAGGVSLPVRVRRSAAIRAMSSPATAGGRCLGSASATRPYRPGRSVLSVAVIASATFMLICGGRVPPRRRARDRRPEIGRRRLPGVRRDRCCRWPTTQRRARREPLNLAGRGRRRRCEAFRLLPGRRRQLPEPVPAAATRESCRRGTVPRAGPVRLPGLARGDGCRAREPVAVAAATEPDGAIPVIADANSMTYVLHAPSATTSSSSATAGRCGCGSSRRCATACSRASW